MSLAIQLVFAVSMGGVLYAYVVYPLLISLSSTLFGRERDAPMLETWQLPPISLLISAHNEEEVIHSRLENALAMDYPSEKLQIVVANDGSTDRTAQIVRSFGARITLLDFTVNRGKAATLNAALPFLTGELVVLSDANTSLEADAARRLVRWFEDPGIGVVCGRLKIVDPVNGSNCDSAYWRFETFLKRCENRLGALLGSNGAIYAIRRQLFAPIPANTIVDDFVIPLRSKVRSGCEIVYDASAVGSEEAAPRLRDEFKRRARIGAGGFQAIELLWRLVHPRFGWTAFAFISHKIMRWLCPMFMLIAASSNVLLFTELPVYRYTLLTQVLFYVSAVTILLLPERMRLPRVLRLAAMFVSINAAILVGFVRWLRGTQQGVWQRTQRVVST